MKPTINIFTRYKDTPMYGNGGRNALNNLIGKKMYAYGDGNDGKFVLLRSTSDVDRNKSVPLDMDKLFAHYDDEHRKEYGVNGICTLESIMLALEQLGYNYSRITSGDLNVEPDTIGFIVFSAPGSVKNLEKFRWNAIIWDGQRYYYVSSENAAINRISGLTDKYNHAYIIRVDIPDLSKMLTKNSITKIQRYIDNIKLDREILSKITEDMLLNNNYDEPILTKLVVEYIAPYLHRQQQHVETATNDNDEQ